MEVLHAQLHMVASYSDAARALAASMAQSVPELLQVQYGAVMSVAVELTHMSQRNPRACVLFFFFGILSLL
jgi:hypothetical protein